MKSRRKPIQLLLVALLSAGVLFLLAFQLVEGLRSSALMVGIEMDETPGRLVIVRVSEGLPADRADLQEGDVLLTVNGVPAPTIVDYDRVAREFSPGTPIVLEVSRDGAVLTRRVVPGVPFPWLEWSVAALAALLHLALGAVVLLHWQEDFRAALLTVFSFAVAVELALPLHAVGDPLLTVLTTCAYALLTGLQLSVELHLASVIPEPRLWLRRYPWAVGVYYLAGLGLGSAMALSAVALATGWQLPWSFQQAQFWLIEVGLPVWALGVLALLASAALRWPYPVGRQQAALVLLGVLPWGLVTLTGTLVETVMGGLLPEAWYVVEPVVILFYPIGVFVAIFRYDLFDLELVVRRGLVYTALTSCLILVFYGVLGLGGALSSRLVNGGGGSVWVVAGATLLLGLLFSPLRKGLERVIERRFFPERTAMRQRLVTLAGELPALGKLPAMGNELVKELRKIFAIRSAVLLLADRVSGLLVTLAGSSSVSRGSQSFLLSPRDPAVESLKRGKRPLLAAQLRGEDSPLAERLLRLKVHLVVPILSQEQLIGLLLLGRKESGEDYPREEMELLDLFSRHVATVFENARLFESATQDSLTGLLRREAVLEQLDKEVERAVRYRRPLTIGMADLDDFKRINDHHGHLAGDLVLKRVAEVLGNVLRTTDTLGRYGGEEFLILLPETDLRGALQVAEKLRERVELLRIAVQGEETVGVTVSIGLASLDQGRCDSPEGLIAAADRWLYRAKEAGRNRVEPMTATSLALS